MTFNEAVAIMDGNGHRTELKQQSQNDLFRENRVGRFSISRHMLLNACDVDLRQLFGTMIVVRAETDFIRDAVDYIAFSTLFSPTPCNTEPPKYHILVHQGIDEEWSFSVQDRTHSWNGAEVSISRNEGEGLMSTGERYP